MAKKAANKTTSKPTSLFKDDKVHWINTNDITKNPLNWREHPANQINALQEAYRSIGFAVPILVNASTHQIIDGHGRLEAAIAEKLKAVPVLLLNVSEDEERLLLQNVDAIQALGVVNAKKVQNLIKANEQTLEKIKSQDKQHLEQLNNTLNDYATIVKASGDKRGVKTIFDITDRLSKRRTDREEDKTKLSAKDNQAVQETYKDDATFDNDEDWNIPLLLTDPRLLCEEPPLQTYDRSPASNRPDSLYCYSARTSDRPRPGGTLAFWTEDYRFSAIFDKCPEYVLTWKEEQWLNIVEPDFSIYDLDAEGNTYPFPLNLYSLYRSRYVLRYAQELGLRVIPTLRWTSDDKVFDASILTLPKNLPWVAIQMRSNLASRPPKEIRAIEEAFEDAINITTPQGLIVYGDINLEAWLKDLLPKKTQLIILRDYSSLRFEQRSKTKNKTP